jgi:hypothetical protein
VDASLLLCQICTSILLHQQGGKVWLLSLPHWLSSLCPSCSCFWMPVARSVCLWR